MIIEKSKYNYIYNNNQTDSQWLKTKKNIYTNKYNYGFVLKDGNSDIGCCSIKETEFLYVYNFSIIPSKRNKGYGKKLIEYLKKFNKPIKVFAEESSIGFYNKLGFKLYKKPYMNIMWFGEPNEI